MSEVKSSEVREEKIVEQGQKETNISKEKADKIFKLFLCKAFCDDYDEAEDEIEDEIDSDIETEDNDKIIPKNFEQQNKSEQKLKPNTIYIKDGDIYETDDTGQIYKVNGKLLPNVEYTVNGINYETDNKGNIVRYNGKPYYNPEGERDDVAQANAGGNDRHKNDDGGHLIARILGGSDGAENLVAMRDTINRGDYKKTENEIANALKEGKTVEIKGLVEYGVGSHRPIKITTEYTIDGVKKVLVIDNVENSTELMDNLKEVIFTEDFENLQGEIDDMQNDGHDVSVTSINITYDSKGNPVSVIFGYRDESTKEKSYKTFDCK